MQGEKDDEAIVMNKFFFQYIVIMIRMKVFTITFTPQSFKEPLSLRLQLEDFEF